MFGFLKGKIEIRLREYNFSPGETIEGEVALSLKKPQAGKELSVSLVGKERVRQRSSGGKGSTTTTHTIFNFKLPLDGPKQYPAGDGTPAYPFQITIPTDATSPTEPEGVLGKVMQTAETLSGTRRTIFWYLKATLKVKGFNVSKKVNINIA